MSSKTKQLALNETMGSEVVKIYVGPKRKEFMIHKKLICDSAKFFEDAFTGPFKEGLEGIMYMPEDDAESFSCFVDWLYRNPVPIVNVDFEVTKAVTKTEKPAKDVKFGPITEEEHLSEISRKVKKAKEREDRKKTNDARLTAQIHKLLNLYYFAEKMFMNRLMNRTMDRLRHGLDTYGRALKLSEVQDIYLSTIKGSKLRVFCAELITYRLDECSDVGLDNLVHLIQDIPDLAKDILFKCKGHVKFRNEVFGDVVGPEDEPDPRGRGSAGGGCFFHQHDVSDSETCLDENEEQYRWRCVDCGVTRHGSSCSCF